MFDFEQLPPSASRTWKYVPWLKGAEVEYASLYLEGKSIGDIVPEYLKEDWEDVSKKIIAFKRSLELAHVDTNENCFYDLVPQRFLIDFCSIQNKITQHVFDNVTKPKRYEFNKHLSQMLVDIETRSVSIDRSYIGTFVDHVKLGRSATNILNGSPQVLYNQFGTKTGRLTTRKNSFPILTLSKDLRSGIVPNNDMFVEIDFNGAEVRTLLGLLEKDQPKVDVHEFHLQKVFRNLATRSDAKTAFFAWLYGSSSAASKAAGEELSRYYDKRSLLDKYWDGHNIKTPFFRTITDVSSHYALNYLVQSTAADLALKQFLKVKRLLETRNATSEIAFLIHDSLVLDMKEQELHLLPVIKYLLSSTNFGVFPVTIKKGNTLGNLREHKWIK
tara:strand:+ start:3981 stop:5141 length:1161 start_codon:yes stop_codon:yes gene_type:complete